MNNEKLAADTGERTFYFYIVQKEPNELNISMYNTPYKLLKGETHWKNSPVNTCNMAQHLIDAVVKISYS